MKVFVLILVATAHIAVATSEPGEELSVKEYSRFIEVPDGDGNLLTIDLGGEPDMDVIADLERNPNNNIYLLFTRRNLLVPQTLIMHNATSIRNSNFNSNRPTSVIVHNWLAVQDMGFERSLIDAFINRNDVNIIVVSWSHLASLDYATASRGTPAIGRGTGQFINFLGQTTGARVQDFHLVGFGLGAHVVGNAGRELGGRVARITGLDPAGPLWTQNPDRIRESDGMYVEAMHTNGPLVGLGIGMNVAYCDIYFNGGNTQPGCLNDTCSHNYAWRVFIPTIVRDQFYSCPSLNTPSTCVLMSNTGSNKSGSCGMCRPSTGIIRP